MTGIKSPTVRHRRLARELRKHRERAGLTTEAASDQLGWSRSKLVRFEAARTRPTAADVHAALDLYGADMTERAALAELARQARQRGWWTAYSDVFQSSYVALEDEASAISSWQTSHIPGLLQTEGYAHALLGSGIRQESANDLDRRVQARIARKALLVRSAAPTLHAILDESVLRRGLETEVMREQLLALGSAARRPNVTIQVLPYSTGMHPGLTSSFVVFDYEEQEDLSVGYVESVGGEIYLESAPDVRDIKLRFDTIRRAALPPEESVEFIAAVMKERPSV
ncbi:helix-turn-helix domain-containing protein [Actinomadura rupiterrae]|uniref:helix-turn-helix domain-containing protein n=1 Tax=Actinomadura rupiterrae TaxID=559627 RepID=UPI0020A3D4AC|nr:helix-turn-helix transcriptional regulator [Actinomadura rupiterrae]MCP2336203.1 transcriptional regulator with XRE-family HTH domain [Actinomadura rupiterrae]